MWSKCLLEGSSSVLVVFAIKRDGNTCLYLPVTTLKASAAACMSLFPWPKRQRNIPMPGWTLTTNCRTGVLTQGWWLFSGKWLSLALRRTHLCRRAINLLPLTWTMMPDANSGFQCRSALSLEEHIQSYHNMLRQESNHHQWDPLDWLID